MNDPTAYRPIDGGRLPERAPFDPRDRALPGTLGEAPLGSVVLLAVGRADREWAADAALELAAAWAREGRRIVLADLHLENPVLHERAGTANLEGVADIFLYGASLARSARLVGDRGFYLISAGTYASDVEAIYRNPRWPKLVAGFGDANASLVLFAPAEGADLAALSEWVSDVVVLGHTDPAVLAPLRERGRPVLGWLVPGGAGSGDETLVAAPAPTVVRLPTAETELDLPPPPVRRRARRGGVSLALWVVLAVVVLAAAGYVFARLRPDLVPWLQPSSAGPAAESLAGLSSPTAPTPAGELLPYSVQVKAFTSLDAAREELALEREAFGATRFYVSPEEIQGILYFKVMAGATPDSARATRTRDRLVDAGLVDPEDAAGSWSLIQYTPFAFELGEFDTPAEAAMRADSLLARDIPTYAMVVPYSDGTRRWRVYGGAYRDSASAEGLRAMLTLAGAPTELVPRAGAPDTVPAG